LYIQECKKNNKYEDFTLKDGISCAHLDNTKCLNGKYNIIPIALKSKEYDNLICSTRFAKRMFPCCSNQNIKVKYVDNIGNWGIENGELCGIGYERCSFSVLDNLYPCCSSVDLKVEEIDENDSWGIEDGEYCGIDEVIIESKYRIRNKNILQ